MYYILQLENWGIGAMKVLRITILSIFASILVAVSPVSPALAAYSEEISLDPDEGEVGDYIRCASIQRPVTHQSLLIPHQLLPHGCLDLFLGPGHLPYSDLVDLAGEP